MVASRLEEEYPFITKSRGSTGGILASDRYLGCGDPELPPLKLWFKQHYCCSCPLATDFRQEVNDKIS